MNGWRIFADYGVNWRWEWDACLGGCYAEARRQIDDYGRPVLLAAISDWLPGERDGHEVVAYGCDETNRQLYVCLGWGASFPDKWSACSKLYGSELCHVMPA